MNALSAPSPAKINLSLRIVGKRPDGFHEISTFMCKTAFADTVTIEASPHIEATTLTCTDATVPADESNLAFKALRLFEELTSIRRGWCVHLDKQIPTGAGLGGGSSNAGTVLKLLNQLCGTPLSTSELAAASAEIGSDIPFFVLDAPAALATGRGEIVTPQPFPWDLPLVLIKPPFPIPTPWAYKNWAASKELAGCLYAAQLCPWGEMVNDLERPVFEKHLLLPALKSMLLESGLATAALMSGSGSTMFAVARSASDAEELAAKARDWCGPTSMVTVTHTLPSP